MQLVPIILIGLAAYLVAGCTTEFSSSFKDVEIKVGDKKEAVQENTAEPPRTPPKDDDSTNVDDNVNSGGVGNKNLEQIVA